MEPKDSTVTARLFEPSNDHLLSEGRWLVRGELTAVSWGDNPYSPNPPARCSVRIADDIVVSGEIRRECADALDLWDTDDERVGSIVELEADFNLYPDGSCGYSDGVLRVVDGLDRLS